jgi:hypothetical protein
MASSCEPASLDGIASRARQSYLARQSYADLVARVVIGRFSLIHNTT